MLRQIADYLHCIVNIYFTALLGKSVAQGFGVYFNLHRHISVVVHAGIALFGVKDHKRIEIAYFIYRNHIFSQGGNGGADPDDVPG